MKKINEGSPKRAALSIVSRHRNPLEIAAQQVAADSAILDIDFAQITRYKGDVANGDATDPVVYAAPVELQMRQLIKHFGFDRLPLTWAELHSMHDYCEGLSQAAGRGIPAESVAGWRKAALKVNEEERPWVIPAIKAYLAGDTAKLTQIHKQDGTLEKLAASWVEYPYEHGHPLASLEDEQDS